MTAVEIPLTDSKRRVVDHLKRVSPVTTQEVAELLDVSDVAARQHLGSLEAAGLVSESQASPEGRGRPRSLWQLTDLATELFPDRHGDLTVELLDALRETVGETGVDALLDVRGAHQLDDLRMAMADARTLDERVAALAAQRSREGYMAEVAVGGDGSLMLIEHHCPICVAARACQGLCRSELEVFQAALGSDVSVERTEHQLVDGRRCVYRIGRLREGPFAQ